jgi:hypothetical protein
LNPYFTVHFSFQLNISRVGPKLEPTPEGNS